MKEDELLGLLRRKFGQELVDRGIELAEGGIRLDKDQKLTDPSKWRYREIGVASISRTESKVQFDLEGMSLQCFNCGLAQGTACAHNIASLIAANRQGFIDDGQLGRAIDGLSLLGSRTPEQARRVCPSCGKPLEIATQAICPKCGRAVCRECIRPDGMCAVCYRRDVLKEKPEVAVLDRETLGLVAKIAIPVAFVYVFATVMLYGEPLEEMHPMLRPALLGIFLIIPVAYAIYSVLKRTRERPGKEGTTDRVRGPPFRRM